MTRINASVLKKTMFKAALLGLCLVFSSSSIVNASSADLQSIIGNTPFYDPSCTGLPSGSSSSPLQSGDSVYILGDSITETAGTEYQSAFQQKNVVANIDAQADRSLSSPGQDGTGTTGVQAIAQDTNEIQQAKAIVIALGTYGGDTNTSIDGAISAVRADNPNAPIYWIDTIVISNPSYIPTIQQANEAIYSQATTENYTVIPWFKTVDPAGNPLSPTGNETDTNGYIDLSDPNHVEPTSTGINALTGLVVNTLTAGTASVASSTSQSSSGNCACNSGSTTTGSTTNNVPIDGNNVKDAFEFFTVNGYSANQSAGIVGNLMYESGGVNPTQEEIGGGGGYGIAQFTPPTALEAWAAANNQDYTTLTAQLDFLIYELNGDESSSGAAVKATSTIAGAAQAFEINFERPAGSNTNPISGAAAASLPNRITDGQTAYNLYDGSAVVTSASSGGCSSASGTSPSCQGAVGDVLILCTAEEYQGNYYLFGGGHDGYSNFRVGCPISSIANDVAASTVSNPGPCATDCSGLVSMALDQAFNQNYDWTVAGAMVGAGSQYWQSIPLNQVQAGDIVTTSEHVEIVDHYDASTSTVYTFGSHYTGTQTGPTSTGPGYFTGAYKWTGPGSGTQ